MENTEHSEVRSQRISGREKMAYGMGSLGNNLVYGIVATYLMYFYTEAWGLSPLVIGTLFLIARLWDGVFDPIMGLIVDNTKTRWGKFRPYLLFAPLVMAPVTIACFWGPELSHTGKIIWAYVTYILWGMSFAAMDIPYWSMSAAITQDPKERNSVVMVPRTLASIGNGIIAVGTLPLVGLLSKYGNTITGWRMVAVIICVLAVGMTMYTFRNVKERVTVEHAQSMNFIEMVKLFVQNRPLKILIISLLLFDTVNSVRMIFPMYYL